MGLHLSCAFCSLAFSSSSFLRFASSSLFFCFSASSSTVTAIPTGTSPPFEVTTWAATALPGISVEAPVFSVPGRVEIPCAAANLAAKQKKIN